MLVELGNVITHWGVVSDYRGTDSSVVIDKDSFDRNWTLSRKVQRQPAVRVQCAKAALTGDPEAVTIRGATDDLVHRNKKLGYGYVLCCLGFKLSSEMAVGLCKVRTGCVVFYIICEAP